MSWTVTKPRIVWSTQRGAWTCATYNRQHLHVEYGGRTPREAYWHWWLSLAPVARAQLAREGRAL